LWRGMHRILPAPRSFRTGYAFAHRFVRGMGLAPADRYLAWAADGFTLDSLRAVAAKRIYHIDSARIERATPRLVEGIAEICAKLELARRPGSDPDAAAGVRHGVGGKAGSGGRVAAQPALLPQNIRHAMGAVDHPREHEKQVGKPVEIALDEG